MPSVDHSKDLAAEKALFDSADALRGSLGVG